MVLGSLGVVDVVDLGRHRPAEGVGRDVLECGEVGVVIEQTDMARGDLRPAPVAILPDVIRGGRLSSQSV